MDKDELRKDFDELLDKIEEEQRDSIEQAFVGEYSGKDVKKASKRFNEIFGGAAPYILIHLLKEYVKSGEVCITLMLYGKPNWESEYFRLKPPRESFNEGNRFEFRSNGPVHGLKSFGIQIAKSDEAFCPMHEKPKMVDGVDSLS